MVSQNLQIYLRIICSIPSTHSQIVNFSWISECLVNMVKQVLALTMCLMTWSALVSAQELSPAQYRFAYHVREAFS